MKNKEIYKVTQIKHKVINFVAQYDIIRMSTTFSGYITFKGKFLPELINHIRKYNRKPTLQEQILLIYIFIVYLTINGHILIIIEYHQHYTNNENEAINTIKIILKDNQLNS